MAETTDGGWAEDDMVELLLRVTRYTLLLVVGARIINNRGICWYFN